MFKIIAMTFIFKLLDNAFSTLKTITLQKEKFVISSLLNAISTFFYVVAISTAIKDTSPAGVVAMCLATFLGTLLPAKFVSKMEKDRLYIYTIISNDYEQGKEFANKLRKYGLRVESWMAYDVNINKILTCKVYCHTKTESMMVKDRIPNGYDYYVNIPEEY